MIQKREIRKRYTRPKGHMWEGIIYHVDLGTYEGTWEELNGTKSASYHYYIKKSGEIVEFVDPLVYQAWHAGVVHEPTEQAKRYLLDRNPNRVAIGICYEGRQVGNDGEIANNAQVKAAAELTLMLEAKYGELWRLAHKEVTSYKPASVLDFKLKVQYALEDKLKHPELRLMIPNTDIQIGTASLVGDKAYLKTLSWNAKG